MLKGNKAPPPDEKDKEQDARLTALESSIGALTNRVTTLELSMPALERRLTTTEQHILALEGRMTIAEGQIAALEDALVPGPEPPDVPSTVREGVVPRWQRAPVGAPTRLKHG
jgi:hypothetical protein